MHNNTRGWFAGAVARSGVPRLTPHDLRHTAASLAISAGANVKAVQRMLGHASAAMTLDTYADLFDEDLDAVAIARMPPQRRTSHEAPSKCAQNVLTRSLSRCHRPA
jgi:integrase